MALKQYLHKILYESDVIGAEGLEVEDKFAEWLNDSDTKLKNRLKTADETAKKIILAIKALRKKSNKHFSATTNFESFGSKFFEISTTIQDAVYAIFGVKFKSQSPAKTDIINSKKTLRMSVKYGASRLMSGKDDAYIALTAAMKYNRAEVVKTFKEVFHTHATDVFVGATTKIPMRVTLSNLDKLINDKTLDQTSKKELKRFRSEIDSIRDGAEVFKASLKDALTNKTFALRLAYEAFSGEMKFAENQEAIANAMLFLSKNFNGVGFIPNITNHNDEYIQKIAQKMSVSINFKTRSGKNSQGRYASYGLNIQLPDVTKKTQDELIALNESINIHEDSNLAYQKITDKDVPMDFLPTPISTVTFSDLTLDKNMQADSGFSFGIEIAFTVTINGTEFLITDVFGENSPFLEINISFINPELPNHYNITIPSEEEEEEEVEKLH